MMLVYECCDSCGVLIHEDRRCLRCVRLVGPYQAPVATKKSSPRFMHLFRGRRKVA